MIPANHDDEAIRKLHVEEKRNHRSRTYRVFMLKELSFHFDRYVRIIYLKPQIQFSVKCNKNWLKAQTNMNAD